MLFVYSVKDHQAWNYMRNFGSRTFKLAVHFAACREWLCLRNQHSDVSMENLPALWSKKYTLRFELFKKKLPEVYVTLFFIKCKWKKKKKTQPQYALKQKVLETSRLNPKVQARTWKLQFSQQCQSLLRLMLTLIHIRFIEYIL